MSDATSTVAPPCVLRGLVKRFKQQEVLKGVDLELPTGSVVGLLGKNGAGKTTLIKCMLGLLKLDGGSARVFGEDAWDLSAIAKAKLGYVSQEPAIYPWMKVRQAIAYHAAFYPHWNGELIERLIDEWELDRNQRIGPLSPGQLQKLAILLALGNEPDLLILDEPAAALDPVARREFIRTVLDVAADGNRTVLLSTHITSDVERVCDRLAVLKGGRLVYDGELGELKDQIKRYRITTDRVVPSTFTLPGVLQIDAEDHTAVLTARGDAGTIERELAERFGGTIVVEDLNLEDIFLELHHDRG